MLDMHTSNQGILATTFRMSERYDFTDGRGGREEHVAIDVAERIVHREKRQVHIHVRGSLVRHNLVSASEFQRD
ncbi:hypothetical protein KZ813_13320 [Sphingomonas sp. RHCKR7]|uniref:hypothetical protein n=1 Tax=Sphingomonas folli TaxID=2862497 RepID=UPI001CA5F247|nr:hypothetical protein [Sphingomonas folli]MBW6527822.1 hypothetical protein [Sphingomonas folli]